MKLLIKSIEFLHKKKIFFLIPCIPVLVVYFIYGIGRTFVVIPDDEMPYETSTYCDGGESGNTVITDPNLGETELSFTYTLKKGAPYPYAGVSMGLMLDSNFLDLSKFDHMIVHLESDNTESFAVYIKAFIDGFSVLNEQFTHEFLMKEVPVDSVSSRYKIKFDEFIHPPWWLEQTQISESKIGKPHITKVISLQVQNGLLTPFGEPVTITIKEISFGREISLAYTILVGFLAVYFVFYFILYKIVHARALEKQVVISYKELEVEDDADGDIKRIIDCVARNFSDSSFTVEKLAREAGVSASKIPGMLKERFKLNFKQYLNTIRISEAKRLLRETDNQIVTLAYTVGYNNIPHFNRTFKQFEEMSPKEYRKQSRAETG